MYAPLTCVYDSGKTVDLTIINYLTGKLYNTLNSAKGLAGASGFTAPAVVKAATEVGTGPGIYIADANPSLTYPLPDGWYKFLWTERAAAAAAFTDKKIEVGLVRIAGGVEVQVATTSDII